VCCEWNKGAEPDKPCRVSDKPSADGRLWV